MSVSALQQSQNILERLSAESRRAAKPMQSNPKPTQPSERRFPKLSAEQKAELLRWLKEEIDQGRLHYKSEGYPSLGPK